jgi:hypothetical protein
VTQIPIEQVPDPRLHERLEAGDDPEQINAESWDRITRWLDSRGLRMTYYATFRTLPIDRERWLGVCVRPPDEANPCPFADHTLVMSYGDILFDPAAKAITARGWGVRKWQPCDVTYGLTFDAKE